MLAQFRILIVTVILSLVVACQVAPKRTEVPAKVTDLSLRTAPQQNQQIARAISLLEKGENAAAKKLIDEVLSFNPNHSNANFLKRQLTLTASQLFNTGRVTQYRVKSGDSLGMIANKWLGNSLYFVSLAKLNKITNPSLLRPGTKINIPVIAGSEIVEKEKLRSNANLELLEQYRSKRLFSKGLSKANSLFIVEEHQDRLLEIHQKLLEDFASSAVSLSEREKMLEAVNQLVNRGRNQQQNALYKNFIQTHNRKLFIDEALLLFDDKAYVESAEKLIAAKRLNSQIKEEDRVFKVEQLLINKLHEQAVVFYRNHALKDALSRWELVLKIQPDNDLAIKYMQRTEKLLSKLNQY